jgi:hypothetical protein
MAKSKQKLEKEIEELQEQLEMKKEELDNIDWPRRVTVVLHNSRENNRYEGEGAGLSEDAIGKFRYAVEEVMFYLDVNQDGTYTIIKAECDGQTLITLERAIED